MSFHAQAAHARKGPLKPFVYEPAPLGPHDVEIRISHCGICHSDVHLVDGDWGVGSFPMVPGHEIVGTVAARGAEVDHLESGQRVGVGWQRGACLACEACGRGEEHLCPSESATCLENHGGFADRIRVDGRFAFPLPEALAAEAAAPLLCAGITVYSPLVRWVAPSMRVRVVGIGVTGGEYYFDPNYIIVKKDVPVDFVIKKVSGFIPHNIIIEAPDAGINIRESMTTEAKIRFTPTKTGKYATVCDKRFLFFANHKEKGMEGVLEVVE